MMVKDDLEKHGYVVLRSVFSNDEIVEMVSRLDQIVAGQHQVAGRRFYVEPDSGKYRDVSHQDSNYSGPSKRYRKIADLEYDSLLLSKVQNEYLCRTCQALIGRNISIMRLTMMNKSKEGGTELPWHQDMGVDWPTDIMPRLAFWFPLDHLSKESGTLQVVSGSHKHGVIGNGHMLEAEHTAYAQSNNIVDILIDTGDVLLFDTCLLHRSGINTTGTQRRAINGILMPGNARHTARNTPYPVIYGDNALIPEEVAQLSFIPS